MNRNAYPFVRFTLFLIGGILLASYFPLLHRLPFSVHISVLSISVLITVFNAAYSKSYRYRWLSGVLTAISFVVLGIFITEKHFSSNLNDDTINIRKMWMGEIISEPDLKAETVKAIFKLTPVNDTVKNKPNTVKALLFFKRDSITESLQPGDILLLNVKLKKPEPPKNPYSFNYEKFLKRKGIDYVSFVNEKKFIKSGNAGGIEYLPDRLRKKLLDVLKNSGLKGDEYAVASAILLGYDKLMDTGLEKAFSGAGAVHVLCVSGLHVGIIYLVFGFLLSFLGKTKKERITKATILLLTIWFYAVITGLAPSVWRASVMISLFIIGEALKRELNPYNTLAASAFILLFINPMLLFDVGFQLSYAAVLGILIFYKPLYSIFYFKNKIVDTIWSATTVSISAQAGAFPVAAHYFHTFPLYFLLTNLAVFALAYVIIITGMLFLILSPIKFLASILGTFLSATVYLMNTIVKFISSLPYAQFQNLYFPWFKVITVYAIILSLFFWFRKKDAKYLQLLLFSVVIFAVSQTIVKLQRLRNSEMVIFNTSKGLAIDINSGKKHLLLTDSLLFFNPAKLNFSVSGYFLNKGLDNSRARIDNRTYKNDFFIYKNGFLLFKNIKIYVTPEKRKHYPELNPKIDVDFVVLNGVSSKLISEISKSFNFKSIIIPASYSKYKREKIKDSLKEINVTWYDIAENGAFIY